MPPYATTLTNPKGMEPADPCQLALDKALAQKTLERITEILANYLERHPDNQCVVQDYEVLDKDVPYWKSHEFLDRSVENSFGTDTAKIRTVYCYVARMQHMLPFVDLSNSVSWWGRFWHDRGVRGAAIPGTDTIHLFDYCRTPSVAERIGLLIHEATHLAGAFGHGEWYSTGPDPYGVAAFATVVVFPLL